MSIEREFEIRVPEDASEEEIQKRLNKKTDDVVDEIAYNILDDFGF